MKPFIDQKIITPATGVGAQLFIILLPCTGRNDEGRAQVIIDCLQPHFPQAVIVTVLLQHSLDLGNADLDTAVLQQLHNELKQSWQTHIGGLQEQFNISTEATAIIGIGALGSFVLELSKLAQPVAGRLIVFGARFLSLPEGEFHLKQTIHLMHAAKDPLVSVEHAKQAHMAIANLQGDLTIDIGNSLEDSLDPLLVDQIRVRLQTAVPLWMWKEIYNSANGEAEPQGMSDAKKDTYH